MHLHAIHRLTLALAALALAAGTILWVLIAAPALAQNHFTPALAATSIDKMPASDAAGYEPTPAPKRLTPIAKPRATAGRAESSGGGSASGSARSGVSEIELARSILAAQIAAHPILKGTTIGFGDTRGYQAISYYRSGRIVLSRTHTASLGRIIGHEVWHVIDWRDNGHIDWGENVPR